MDKLPMNPVDMAVIAVFLLSALLALSRGFVAEVVTIVTWAGAALATLYAMPYALPIAQSYIKHEMLAYAAAGAAVFLVSLILLTLVGGQLSSLVQRSGLSAIDRSLGFLFGFVKAAAIVSVAYLFFSWLVPVPEHPAWLKEARSLPLLRAGATMIVDLVPENLRQEAINRTQLLRDKAQAADDLSRLATPVPAMPKADAAAGDHGYKQSERNALDQAIQQNVGTSPAK
jgi:membrane protein required for colicin V production